MIKMKRLYSVPKIFDDIVFVDGVNLILGEPSEKSAKTNGVGKSVAIEFLNFAFLSKYSTSRVKKIPEEVFPLSANICLDLDINAKNVTISRCRGSEGQPTVTVDGATIAFSKLEDAQSYLGNLSFHDSAASHPSFRGMLGIFIRDERSEFKSIVNGYDTTQRIPDDYTPHLYLLGIDVGAYKKVRSILGEIKSLKAKIKEFDKSVRLLRNKSIDDARADLNELDAEVSAIEEDIEGLENSKTYEILESEIQGLENEISDARRRSATAVDQLSRIEPVEQEQVDISAEELSEYYNDLRAGLGDLVSRDFQEIVTFKDKILKFQGDALRKRRETLESKLEVAKSSLRVLDKEYKKKLRLLDQNGALRALRQTFATYQEKSNQLANLRSFILGHDDAVSERREKLLEKDIELQKLQTRIDAAHGVIKTFETTILGIHHEIMGNRQASFKLETVSLANIIDLTLRIDSDGSHSVEREKTFIYDFSLLTNDHTCRRHFGFLVHDNIFEVDTDTLRRSLSFIADEADKMQGQYILTLNSDRANVDAPDAMDKLQGNIRATFTKDSRFLKRRYQEK